MSPSANSDATFSTFLDTASLALVSCHYLKKWMLSHDSNNQSLSKVCKNLYAWSISTTGFIPGVAWMISLFEALAGKPKKLVWNEAMTKAAPRRHWQTQPYSLIRVIMY